MRKFTNPKSIELVEHARALEEEAAGLPIYGSLSINNYGELMTTAAGLRVLADDLEDGLISEEELEDA